MGRSKVGKVGRGRCFVKFAVKVLSFSQLKIAAGVCPAVWAGLAAKHWAGLQLFTKAHAGALCSGRRQAESPHAVGLRPEKCVADVDASGAQNVFIRAPLKQMLQFNKNRSHIWIPHPHISLKYLHRPHRLMVSLTPLKCSPATPATSHLPTVLFCFASLSSKLFSLILFAFP